MLYTLQLIQTRIRRPTIKRDRLIKSICLNQHNIIILLFMTINRNVRREEIEHSINEFKKQLLNEAK